MSGILAYTRYTSVQLNETHQLRGTFIFFFFVETCWGVGYLFRATNNTATGQHTRNL